MTLLEPSGEHDERLLRFVVRHPFRNTEEVTSSVKRSPKGASSRERRSLKGEEKTHI